MTDENEYILGTDRQELERLLSQHKAWLEPLYGLLRRAGFGQGDALIDLGCGPGYTTLELAVIVGERGRVVACDESRPFLEFLAAECDRLAIDNVETALGSVEELALEDGSLDGGYARWLFCWLTDPEAVLARVARALRPGGVLALQEYVDWGVLKLVPEHPAIDRAVAACMQSWELGGGRINVARDLVECAPRCGLAVEAFTPVARIGAVGSPEWRWIGGFFESYLPRLVERGLLTAEEHDARFAAWQACEESGRGWVFAPVVADLTLRKS